MNRQSYSKWRNATARYLKKKKVKIQRKSLTKLQTKINNAVRGLNARKNKTQEWSFEDVAEIVTWEIGCPCKYCGEIIKWNTWSLDHKKPVARGGTNDYKNIQVIDKRCNRAKGGFSHKFFKDLIRFVSTSWPKYRKELLARLSFGGSYHSN